MTVAGVNYAKVTVPTVKLKQLVLIFLLLKMIKLLVCGVCYCDCDVVFFCLYISDIRER